MQFPPTNKRLNQRGLFRGYPRAVTIAVVAGLLGFCVVAAAQTLSDNAPPEQVKAQPVSPAGDSSVPEPALKSPEEYGLWVLAPPLVAIGLAIVFRQVVPALAVGILAASYMLLPCMPASERFTDVSVIAGLRVALETYVIGQLGQSDKIQVILFTLLIGAMVGVISANGGTRALVGKVSRFASTSRRGQFTGWLAGMIVFFDDYANSMIVGPTMRPMFDRLRISRAKLAYIVDSTAAPIASIALIGTWLGTELSYIKEGLDQVRSGNTPLFLEGVNQMGAFINSIPYRFYPILALWLVLVIALSGRDFGPMRKHESRALATHPSDDDSWDPSGKTTVWWLAGIPILVLIGVTLGILILTGWQALGPDEKAAWDTILRGADSYRSILYGALSGLSIAYAMSILGRACTLREATEGAMDGMARMFPTVVILVLAWSLSRASLDLMLGEVVRDHLVQSDLQAVWLPAIVFICSAFVSFATGTSWGTMAILTPVVVQIAAGLAESAGTPQQSLELFYSSIGAVLAGSVFGDHCSPISDTTVLSSVASSCSVEDHVWTQMPYALVAALVAVVGGNVFCAYLNQSVWAGLAVGAVALVIVVMVFGRRPSPPRAPIPVPTMQSASPYPPGPPGVS